MPSPWDVITMFDFIEHVRDPSETLRVAASLLAPGGKVVLSTPRSGSFVHRLSGGSWPQYREEHLALFSSTGLDLMLERAGLQLVSRASTVKYCSTAYLLGQAATYGPRRLRPFVRHAAPRALRLAPTHWLIPFHFGEMTAVAIKRP
jgi:hypothetical protein